MVTNELPLASLRILDFTRLLPGPFCTAELGDLGADVVKIEDAGAGDYLRQTPPLNRKFSFLYTLVNRNKRSMCLDFERARPAILEMVKTADVFVEGFRPGVMEAKGYAYHEMKKINPRLVYCSITGYGQWGPMAARAGHDLNYCALSGLSSQIGRAGRLCVPNLPIADVLAGAKQAAIGILAAVIDARHTGTGRHVDVSMFDGCIANQITAYAAMQAFGKAPEAGADLLSGAMPFYDLYPTSDGRYVALAAIEAKFWNAFCTAVAKPEWIARHYDFELRAELEALFASQTFEHWKDWAQKHECCLEPVLTLDEAVRHPHTLARNILVETLHPSEGVVSIPLTPIRMSNFSPRVFRHAPERGADNNELRNLYPCSDDEFEAMSGLKPTATTH